jgi:hypothetical protein
MMLMTTCKKSEIYPSVPQIEYKSYYLILDDINPSDTMMGIVFGYKDGDGDIGLNDQDTFPPFNSVTDENNKELNPYHYNVYIEYWALQNGKMAPIIKENTTDTLREELRLANITPDGKYKAIRGDIDSRVKITKFSRISRTVKFKITLYDRALHKSNVAESAVINL